MTNINKLKYELFPHASYSPYLTLSDYFLFPKLRKWLDGKRFPNNNEMESAADDYFEELDNSRYTGNRRY